MVFAYTMKINYWFPWKNGVPKSIEFSLMFDFAR